MHLYHGGAEIWCGFTVPLLAVMCIFYGALFALAAPFIVLPFFIPIAVLAALVVWTLPLTEQAPTGLLDKLYWILIASVVWPNYLALALPGLPWITMDRLTNAPLALTLLVCISVSREFRAQLVGVMRASPWLSKFLIFFFVLQFLSIFLSQSLSYSTSKFVAAQFAWTSVFFASCHFFLKPGRAIAWSKSVWLMAVFVGAIGIWEHALARVPWSDHIPSFLKIEDPAVLRTLAGTVRDFTGRYRSVSTFSTPLGLAEYIAITLPFVLHFLVEPYRPFIRASAFLSVPFLLYAVSLTDARLGMVGCIISLVGYGLIWAIQRWRSRPDSIIGPAIVLMYPSYSWRPLGLCFLFTGFET